ncbi:Aromatic-ring hydroxylase-like protein [Niveomyces insectorum RCEF 264]|uniref:Aromatic-ring hydroxylase-like protein n=1 Tax=Niveomyces insectorum RCEF 264 TaxID=1081102 RepID=A0A167UPW5_9HYPO|nr:Aromatic-ring hydroxylase-like protein [Niveomyces insectorum RCEF 264]
MVLSVAIVGGGVGGLTAAIALRRHPGVSVQVYERATEFREIGALIGMAPNGQRTLEKLGVTETLTDEAGWRSPNGVPMCFRHYKTDDLLSQDFHHHVPDRRHQFARMHRAKLQSALLQHLPRDILHLGKRCTGVDVDEHGATVRFDDGTVARADLVVGADGIKSKVRAAFKPDHPLLWSGDAIFRTTFPYELVADLPVAQNSTHYQSPHGWIFATRIGSDEFGVTCSYHVDAVDRTSTAFRDIVWDVPAAVDDIRPVFRDFVAPIPAIIDRIPEGSLRRYANIVGAALDQWTFRDRVVLLGDAAHTHGGAFAAGASLAIDDAYTLYLAVRAVFAEAVPVAEPVDAAHIGRALQLYEAARRPHAARMLALVHAERAKALARDEKARLTGQPGETDEEFRQRWAARRDAVWLNEHDAEAAFRDVLEAQTQGAKKAQSNGTTEGH